MTIRTRIKEYMREDARYFAASAQTIASQNSRMLTDSCVLYAGVLVLYTILAYVTCESALLQRMYIAFDILHLLLCALVLVRRSKLKTAPAFTRWLCFALEISVLGFFMLEGALTSPERPSLYVPIAILLVQLVFIHRALTSLVTITSYTVAFAVLSYLGKTPEAFAYDLDIALASFISATVGYFLMAKMRRSEQNAVLRFEDLSKRDLLTGLFNKMTLDRVCRELIAGDMHPCAFIIMDLDRFKQINDTYGHIVGDEVLRAFGKEIQSSFRSGDCAGRFGGDEFAVLMDRCDDVELIRRKMENLRERIASLALPVPDLAVQFCAGVTVKRVGDDYDSMFLRADRALYEAKEGGRDQIVIR